MLWRSETTVTLMMAFTVGLGSGLGAAAFRWLIDSARRFFFGTIAQSLLDAAAPGSIGVYAVAVIPALGGLIVGLIAHFVAPEARGPGVSSVMEALALRRGRIRPVVVAARPIATSLTLGSGGSAGREGPVVQLGAAIGSALSRLADLPGQRTKSLVACGAAGGVAATFNAPLAGVMFALEVLLADFGLVQFTSVVVAAVVASVVGHACFGAAPAFSIPPAPAPQTWEFPAYAGLGIAAAFAGVGFTRALYAVDGFFGRLRLPPYLRPALGGLMVGLVGLVLPGVLGTGYDSIEAVLSGRLALLSIAALGFFKIVATSVTIGSGGSGGIFGPCLFIGAMIGGLFGQLIQRWAPGPAVTSSYAVVGMAAVFAAASHAPITAILTLFEMTRDYGLMLPLMLASVTSATLARRLLRDSIYTVKLARRGIDVYGGRRFDQVRSPSVGDAMTPIQEVKTVMPSTPLSALARLFDETHHHGAIVVDKHGRLEGIVTLSDLETAPTEQLATGTVADVQVSNVRTVFPDQELALVVGYFAALNVGRIPVVDPEDAQRVVGLLRREDVVRAYSHAVLEQRVRAGEGRRADFDLRPALGLGEPGAGTPVVEARLDDQHWAVGRSLRELKLPPDALIVSVRRRGRLVIPRGETRLEAGDVITALVEEGEERAFRRRLRQRVDGPGR